MSFQTNPWYAYLTDQHLMTSCRGYSLFKEDCQVKQTAPNPTVKNRSGQESQSCSICLLPMLPRANEGEELGIRGTSLTLLQRGFQKCKGKECGRLICSTCWEYALSDVSQTALEFSYYHKQQELRVRLKQAQFFAQSVRDIEARVEELEEEKDMESLELPDEMSDEEGQGTESTMDTTYSQYSPVKSASSPPKESKPTALIEKMIEKAENAITTAAGSEGEAFDSNHWGKLDFVSPNGIDKFIVKRTFSVIPPYWNGTLFTSAQEPNLRSFHAISLFEANIYEFDRCPSGLCKKSVNRISGLASLFLLGEYYQEADEEEGADYFKAGKDAFQLKQADIQYLKNLVNSGKYKPHDAEAIECQKCSTLLPAYAKEVLEHFREYCPEEEGISCNQKPYCSFIGRRREMWEHLDNCGYQKYECERCEATVIRKIADKHDCYHSVTERLKKLERTIAYVRERYSGQTVYKDKTIWVMDQVRKNMYQFNKRLDMLMFPDGKDVFPESVFERYNDVGVRYYKSKPQGGKGPQQCRICRIEKVAWYICSGCNGPVCNTLSCRVGCFRCVHSGTTFCKRCISYCKSCKSWYCARCKCQCFFVEEFDPEEVAQGDPNAFKVDPSKYQNFLPKECLAEFQKAGSAIKTDK